MKTKKFPALAALVLFAATLGLSACNTMEGAGQDVSAGGKALERSADRNKGY
jgi:predicted small secreted protein